MTQKEQIKARLTNMSQEALERLSDEQTDFIVHPLDKSCFLKACPGSGKTEVVGIKAAYEIANWEDTFSGMAILSFTKNAAKEIADRVAKYDGINATKHPHYIGTIDAWLHSYILHPFGHKVTGFHGKDGDKSYNLMDNSTDAPFLENEKYRLSYLVEIKKEGKIVLNDDDTPKTKQVPYFNTEYTLNYKGIPTPNKESTFPYGLSETNLKQKKQNFLLDGFATYQDAEYLSYKLLNENILILEMFAKRFPVIFIDECQDLSQSQIRLLHLLKEKGVHLLFIGDLNQAIYEFRKVDIEKFTGLISHHKVVEKNLTQNYRSNQQIVDCCQNLEKIVSDNEIQKVTGKQPLNHNDNVILWEYEENGVQNLPEKFIEIINERNIDIKNSAILGRSHSLLASIRPDTNSKYNKIELFANALNCWNVPNRTGKDLQNALQQLGKSVSLLAYKGRGNHQHQYCPDSLSQIEWRNFLFTLIKTASETLHPFQEKTWTEWVKSLKSFLENYWKELPVNALSWDNVSSKIISPSGEAKNSISDSINLNTAANSEKIRLTTIHDVKGETLDAVLLISAKDKKSKGGHFEHWISKGADHKEFVRFAYVASSRPKHLLVWAVPKLKKNGENFIEILQRIGFKF